MSNQPLLVAAADVRDYMSWNQTPSTSQYSDQTIGYNIQGAQSELEQATARWFVNRPSVTYTTTSMLRQQVPIPGFRAFTSINQGGVTLNPNLPNPSVWPVQDAMQTGIYVSLVFRPPRIEPGYPWWLALGSPTNSWFDQAADSPFDPRNYGGGYVSTSMPNDLVIVGDGGYAPGTEPDHLLRTIVAFAAFKTLRPASLLADIGMTPQGGILNYSGLPNEVKDFIGLWRGGPQIVSVG